MKSKSSVLCLTVSNKPTFLIHGCHGYNIWHGIIFHSSKQNENPEIKKTLTGKGCCPLWSLYFFSISILKAFAELSFPVALYYTPGSFKYRKYLFFHSAVKLLLLQMDFSLPTSSHAVRSGSHQNNLLEKSACNAAQPFVSPLPSEALLSIKCLNKKSS